MLTRSFRAATDSSDIIYLGNNLFSWSPQFSLFPVDTELLRTVLEVYSQWTYAINQIIRRYWLEEFRSDVVEIFDQTVELSSQVIKIIDDKRKRSAWSQTVMTDFHGVTPVSV